MFGVSLATAEVIPVSMKLISAPVAVDADEILVTLSLVSVFEVVQEVPFSQGCKLVVSLTLLMILVV